jgi:hypothetical protein
VILQAPVTRPSMFVHGTAIGFHAEFDAAQAELRAADVID